MTRNLALPFESRRMGLAVATALIAMAISGCTNHEIDTFEEYCEDISGVDLQKKYGKFWQPTFMFSYNGDAIRSDYVTALNEMYMKGLDGRAKRMVWRDRTILHLTNPESYWRVEKAEFIGEWQDGIRAALNHKAKDNVDLCLFGTAARLFDRVEIHTLTSKVGIWLDTDTPTLIVTDRRRHFDWVPD